MRSLAPKLLLAFLAVSLTVALLAAAITRYTTQKDFEALVLSNAQNNFMDRATTYYEATGSWRGFFESIIRRQNPQGGQQGQLQQPVGEIQNPPLGQLPAGQQPRQPGDAPPQQQQPPPQQPAQLPQQQTEPGNPTGTQPLTFALINTQGRVVVPAGKYHLGDFVPTEDIDGTIIEIEGETIGIVIPTGDIPSMAQREELFLARTNQSLLYATLGAMAIALVISLVLTRGLTRPLRELTSAIRHTAKGEFGRQVKVHSKDEIGQLARDFNQMSADLAHLSEQRRQMTADIAHDLRTPLTVIAGYIESMRDGVLKPTPERLETMHKEVHHLQRLVDDLRTLSLAEAGELSLNRAPIAPLGLLEQVKAAYQHAAGKKGIELTIQADPDLPRINADPDRMMQVLGNLVSNALRYTPEGGVISVSGQQSVVSGQPSVKFCVADTGSGINPADISRIFDRFYRVDDARNGEGGETGLGLAIAKSIVEMHGGLIGVESEWGRGTRFTIELPG